MKESYFGKFSILIFAVVVLFLSLAILPFVSANFEVGNLSHSVDLVYGPEEFVKGWINISLNNEPTNSLFKTNLNDEIKVIELLELNDLNFECNPLDCLTDYSSGNAQTSKTFTLNRGNSKVYGIKFSGNINDISSIEFDVNSNAPASCLNQLKIDILADDEIEHINDKISNLGSCSLDGKYGCFETQSDTETFNLGAVPYCQKIKLPEAPGFKIGAWVKKVGTENSKVKMTLYEDNSFELESCVLPEASTGGSEISCDVDVFASQREDYYVCINSEFGDGEYQIRGNVNPENECGFFGDPIGEPTTAYQIFFEAKRFGAVGEFNVENVLQNNEEFSFLVFQYIDERYNNDCSGSEGCIVPIKFISNENQQVTISNSIARYEKTSGNVITDKFYDLNEVAATLSSGFERINLDKANFSVSDEFGNFTFTLKLNEDEIFSEEISVEEVPVIVSLKPSATVAALPTKFYVNVSSKRNITNYEWDFGNGDNEETSTNSVVYSYNSTGIYEIEDLDLLSSSKVFDFIVGSPKDAVNSTLINKLADLNKVKSEIAGLEIHEKYRNKINTVLELDSVEDDIKRLQRDYAVATDDDDYTKIMSALLDLEVPKSVIVTEKADDINFFAKEENINLNVLEIVGGGSYNPDNEQAYIEAVNLWNAENLDTELDYKEISTIYQHSSDAVLRIFDVNIKEQTSLTHDYFFMNFQTSNF